MQKIINIVLGGMLLLQIALVQAGEVTGSVNTGTSTGPEGTVISAPTASPAAGTYSSTQSVSLSASGAPYLCYTSDGTSPVCDWNGLTCTTGTKYSSAVSVASTTTLKALSCYQGSQSSSVSSFTYTISTTSSSGGGGGGGSSGPNTTTPYTLTTIESSTPLNLLRPLDLEKSNGKITRPIVMENYYSGYTIEIEKGTEITYASDGKSFSGTLIVPSTLSRKERPDVPAGFDYIKMIEIGDEEGRRLLFSTPYTLTIPLSLEESQSPDKVAIYFYDQELEVFVLIGGEVSADGTSISVELSHMSIFAVFYIEEETEFPAGIGGPEDDDEIIFFDIAFHWAKDYINKLAERGITQGKEKGVYAPDTFINRAEFVTIVARAFEWEIPETVTKTNFSDVTTTDWFAPYVQVAVEKGVIEGNVVGDKIVFRPSVEINRAEAMKVVLLAAGVENLSETDSGFDDIPTDAWFTPYVTYAKKQGIVSGKSERIFAPSDSLTRGEIAKILSLLLNF